MKGIGFSVIAILFSATMLLGQEFEIYQGDTINRRDMEKKRVGYWIFFDRQQNKKSEGYYKDNRKDSVWVFYYPSGQRKAEITFKRGRKKGLAKAYYPDGKVSEEGFWDMNKWTGEYKAYHENGKLAYDWNYNNSGKKVGEQKYFFPDGKLMVKGEWQAGKITGKLTEFYSDGTVKAERVFVDGKVNHEETRFFEPHKPDIAKKDSLLIKSLPPGNQNKIDDSERQITSYFDGEGFHKIYKDSLISREGEFKSGNLFNGKHYIYNAEGKLLATRIYQEGKLVKVEK